MVLSNTRECMSTLRKNEYGLVHARLCNGAAASLPWKLLRTYLESLARTSCRLLFTARSAARPPAGNPLPDAVRFKNPSKSTLAHDAVAAVLLHKHYPIIRIGAGLIQFVCGSRSRLATGVTSSKILFPPFFCSSFLPTRYQKRPNSRTRCGGIVD